MSLSLFFHYSIVFCFSHVARDLTIAACCAAWLELNGCEAELHQFEELCVYNIG